MSKTIRLNDDERDVVLTALSEYLATVTKDWLDSKQTGHSNRKLNEIRLSIVLLRNKLVNADILDLRITVADDRSNKEGKK